MPGPQVQRTNYGGREDQPTGAHFSDTVDQNSDVSVQQVVKEILAVIKDVPQERISEWTAPTAPQRSDRQRNRHLMQSVSNSEARLCRINLALLSEFLCQQSRHHAFLVLGTRMVSEKSEKRERERERESEGGKEREEGGGKGGEGEGELARCRSLLSSSTQSCFAHVVRWFVLRCRSSDRSLESLHGVHGGGGLR